MPRRVRHAADGTRPQAGAERGRHPEDCEVRVALRADHAARSHRVRHAHFAGHGDLPEFTCDETDARGGAGIAAHQPPARLPHLRPGWRMQAAGILRRAWAGEEQVRRGEGPQAESRGPRAAHRPRRRALRALHPLHPFHQGHRRRRRARHRQSRQLQHHRRMGRGQVRQQLHAQHGGYLPGGRAHLEGFPLPDARVVHEGNQVPLHELRHRLQHRRRLARGEGLSLRAAPERRGELDMDVRLRPLELQVDWPRGPAEEMWNADCGARND